MNRIRLLPEHVANQIAAGEVVERPASVVKELVENALDARSTRIAVEIQAGGRSLIRVTDDGGGMSRDDALMSLERHATSKIQRAEDLAAIATMGFRGEALPSIASVSRFMLTTREHDAAGPEGTRIVVGGGKILEVKDAGRDPGTTVEVRQLFFNLPARRKFLRAEETESAHVQHYLILAALAFPEVAFTFQKDGRLVWQLPAVKSGPEIADRLPALRERLRALYGDEQKLLTVNHADVGFQISDFGGEESESGIIPPQSAIRNPQSSDLRPPTSDLRLWGFIGAPGVARSTREDQHVFVNRRPVENRGLNYALLEGYHTALMKGKYPVCCLFLEIDPASVDVNIHPAKREVKFHREGDVRRAVAQAVREVLLSYHTKPGETPTEEPGGEKMEVGSPRTEGGGQMPILPGLHHPVVGAPRPAEQTPLRMGFARTPEESPTTRTEHSTPIGSGSTFNPDRIGVNIQPRSDRSQHSTPNLQNPAATSPIPSSSPQPSDTPQSEIRNPHSAVPLLSVPLRLVGVIGRLYVILESDRGLVLLDQHAAHERILFEQMMNRLEQHDQAPSQKLLLPETVELSARDADFLCQQLASLTRMGVGLSEFGERTFLLDALPPFVKVPDARRFVLELVDQLKAAGQEVNTLRLGELTVAKTVCRHAVKANDPLGGSELENLVEDLRRCSMPYTCPHGRPTLIEMNFRELEKKFGRTQ